MAKATTAVAIRIPNGQLRKIDQRARKLGLSRTQLLIRSALGEIEPADRLADAEARLSAVEERLDALEARK